MADKSKIHSILKPEYRVAPCFKYSDTFRSNFLALPPPEFGFDGFGGCIFYRTYSRKMENGKSEAFVDTILRVGEGLFSIRKHHLLRQGPLPPNFEKDAEDFCHYVYTMRILPPGRAMWACGTDFMYRMGSTCLNNCAFISTRNDLADSISMIMDYLMLGVGVGFDTQYRGPIHHMESDKTFVYIIPDSREGWVDSIQLLIEAHTKSSDGELQSEMVHETCMETTSAGFRGQKPIFDYSKLRASGEKIKGFGGTASGPAPLVKLHNEIIQSFDKFIEFRDKYGEEGLAREGPSDYNYTRLIADLANFVGCCVVAGNVRRCLPKGSLVHLRKGMTRIEHVNVGDEVLTGQGYKRVSNVFVQGLQNLVRINTQDGEFECTPNHRVLVLTSFTSTKWVEASKLKTGDRLITTRQSVEGGETVLPPCTDMKNLPELDVGIAWLFGVIQSLGVPCPMYETAGEGAHFVIETPMNTPRVVFNQLLIQLVRFGINPVVSDNRIDIRSTPFVWYITRYMAGMSIPEFITDSTVPIRMAYLAGIMDIAGSSKTAPVKIISTLLPQYAKQLQQLLYSCGVESRVSQTVERSVDGWDVIHSVCLITQYAIDVFRHTAPMLLTGSSRKSSGKVNSFPKYFDSSARDLISVDKYQSTYCPVAVVSVDHLDTPDYTFDIEVEDNHQFFCNGYLVHNSAEICIGEPSSQTFLNLKNYDLNPERANMGWMSNNTCKFSKHEDFSHIPDICERIKVNGEPGFGNFLNINKYGRIGDHKRESWSRETEPDLAEGMNPCAEIPLEDGELCNLAEVIPSRCLDASGKFSNDIYFRALYYATLCASTISLLMTHRERTNEKIKRNRRIGVSQTGIADIYTLLGFTKCTELWRKGYNFVRACNHLFAQQAGVPDSIRVTTVKPSGTLSLLAGVSPGMHFPTFKYARRRVRIAQNSPIAEFLIKQGVPHEPDLYSQNTEVFSFSIQHGETREASEVGIREQFMLLTTLQREWADNMVSVTIYFDRKKESDILEECVGTSAPIIKSCSILPHTDEGVYPQSPYQRITREEYRATRKYNKIDWTKYSGNSDGECERFCTNDTCELRRTDVAVNKEKSVVVAAVGDTTFCEKDDYIEVKHEEVRIPDPETSSSLASLLKYIF